MRYTLLILLGALTGCSSTSMPVAHKIKMARLASASQTVKLPGLYFCDHSCDAAHAHAHPAGCKSHDACPPVRFEKNGSIAAGQSTDGCAGARWGGTGILPAIAQGVSLTRLVTQRLRQDVRRRTAAEANNILAQIAPRVPVDKREAVRQRLASFLGEKVDAQIQLDAILTQAQEQLLRRLRVLKIEGGKPFGCGERRQIGLELEIKSKLSVDWIGHFSCWVTPKGELTSLTWQLEVELVHLRISFPIVAVSPESGRKPTRCNCKK